MNEIQNTKLVSVTPPAAIIDNASATTTAVDTLGYTYARFVVYLGATDIAMDALKVQESDASDMTGAADVTGLVFGTSANIAGSTSSLPSATDDNKFFVFEIDLRGRKRYLDLVATIGNGAAGTYFTAFAELSGATNAPRTAAERGCGDILRV
jgi:uncharacterized protein involved in type VI secretion and phage assembly